MGVVSAYGVCIINYACKYGVCSVCYVLALWPTVADPVAVSRWRQSGMDAERLQRAEETEPRVRWGCCWRAERGGRAQDKSTGLREDEATTPVGERDYGRGWL